MQAVSSAPIESVVVLIQKGDQFLLIKRSTHVENASGYWCPVAGRVENGETQADAVTREVKEETGLDVEADTRVAQIPSEDGQFELNFWTTKNVTGSITLEPTEVEDYRWVTIKEMEQLEPIFQEDINIMKRLEAGPRS